MNNLMNKRMKKQRGFSLVELAVVMVIVGILLGAILKGQQMIENARGKRLLSDMKSMEALAWTFYDRKGVFPGDCDGNGKVGVAAVAPLATGSPTTALNATWVAGPITDDDSCNGATGTDDIDTPIGDLREEQLLPWGLSNSMAARHSMNGEIQFGYITHSVSTTDRNVIMVFDIPQWMAEMIDANIDGEVNGATGRVRSFITPATPEGAAWAARTAVEANVAIAYLFDKSF